VDRLAAGIARVSLIVACTLTAAIFLLVNVEVVCRYAFGTSTLIADEYAAYGFAGMVYLGMVHAVQRDLLIRIDIPGGWARFVARPELKLFAAVATLALNLALFYAAGLTFMASVRFQSHSIQASRTLIAWPQAVMLTGIALLVLISIAIMVRGFRRQSA
jgi:TRAP-type C4-dicarboxylate transport system permease small subunit